MRDRNPGIRAIGMGALVIVIGTSLPKTWMVVAQCIAGAVLVGLGVWDCFSERRRH